MQQPLFPIQLVNEEPAGTGTADLKLVGWDSQFRKFAVKTVEDHPLLPITEWLCHHLCRACSIPTPDFHVVRRLNGSDAFGSAWVTDATEVNPASTPLPEVERLIREGALGISMAMMMGAFVADSDRRVGNFLYRKTVARVVAIAFDWSRVPILFPPPFSAWPWKPGCNSEITSKYLKHRGWLSEPEIKRIKAELQGISSNSVEDIIKSAPPSWSKSVDSSLIVDWWNNHSVKRADDSQTLILT